MLYLVGLARIPVAIAGGILAGHLYLRGVWWLLEHRASAIAAATP